MENNQQISLDISVKPLYADDVAVATTIKQDKTKRGRIIKEGNVSLIFYEAMGKTAIARVTLSKTTAKSLTNILKVNVQNLEKELRSKEELKGGGNVDVRGNHDNYIG